MTFLDFVRLTRANFLVILAAITVLGAIAAFRTFENRLVKG